MAECEHRTNRDTCTACIRRLIRRMGAAGLCCVLCDKVGHSARYCPQTSVGRARMRAGLMLKAASRPEAAE